MYNKNNNVVKHYCFTCFAKRANPKKQNRQPKKSNDINFLAPVP